MGTKWWLEVEETGSRSCSLGDDRQVRYGNTHVWTAWADPADLIPHDEMIRWPWREGMRVSWVGAGGCEILDTAPRVKVRQVTDALPCYPPASDLAILPEPEPTLREAAEALLAAIEEAGAAGPQVAALRAALGREGEHDQ